MSVNGHGVLLNDIPCPAFQAIVDRLSGRDVATLRLVRNSISRKATHATRSIVLRLSGHSTSPSTISHARSAGQAHASTAHGLFAGQHAQDHASTDTDSFLQQLRVWRQNTRRFDHVPAVHIHVSGKLSAQQWGAAIRVLALRGNVKTLRILPAPTGPQLLGITTTSSGSIYSTAAIPSLVPVRQLLPDLDTLTVEGVTVTNMSEDVTVFLEPPSTNTPPLSPPAAAAAATAAAGPGFTALQHLNLSCAWSPSGSLRHPAAFIAAMGQLLHTFPYLSHLTLQLPALLAPTQPYLAPNAAQVAAAGGAAAATAAAAVARASAAATAAAQQAHMQASMLAAATAAAAALPKLQQLHLARVPDIWAGPGSTSHSAPAAAAEGATVPAAAFRTLDDLGSWLLLRLPLLNQLQIDTVGATCCMAWDRAPAYPTTSSSSSSSNSSGVSEAPPPGIKLTYHAGMRLASPSSSSSSCITAPRLLLPELASHLSRYSRRSAAEAVAHITSLQAALHPDQLSSTAAALAAMPALRHLKLTVLATSSKPTDFAALTAAAAAAAGDRLRSLTLLPGLGKVEVAATALLPLVAAAGGSANKKGLRELRLVGNFSSSSSSSGFKSPWALLREMQGLEGLRVHQIGSDVLQLPVDCLPAVLRVFEAKRVHLLAPSTAAAGSCGDVAHSPSSSSSSSRRNACTGLQVLTLQDCRLDGNCMHSLGGSSSSGDSSGGCLQKLSIAATELPGGWAAAVAAWPNLRHLTLCPSRKGQADSVHGTPAASAAAAAGAGGKGRGKKNRGTAGGTSDAAAAAAATAAATAAGGSGRVEKTRAMGDSCTTAATAATTEEESVGLVRALAGFKHLRGLDLQHLPYLSPAGLHVALSHMPHLSHLSVSAAGVAPDLSAAAAAAANIPLSAGSSSSSSSSWGCAVGAGTTCTGSSLTYISLRLPAARSRTVAAAAVATGAPGDADVWRGSESSSRSRGVELQKHIMSVAPWCGVLVAADMCAAVLGTCTADCALGPEL